MGPAEAGALTELLLPHFQEKRDFIWLVPCHIPSPYTCEMLKTVVLRDGKKDVRKRVAGSMKFMPYLHAQAAVWQDNEGPGQLMLLLP